MAQRLSVAIIAKNEQRHLPVCLESVAFADEIVVVDGGSTDQTAAIARHHGARVIAAPIWPGFGPQKNLALSHCTGNWVLSLDADERVSAALAAEIRAAIDGGDLAAYAMPRASSFLGRTMRHGGWWPDYCLRLFPRDHARFDDARVHEAVRTDLPVRRLTQPLLHESFSSVEQVLDKMNHYSSEGAQMRTDLGRGSGLRKAVAHGLWTFLRTYILRRGFLDGREGFLLAVSNAEGTYYKYVKAMLAMRPQGPKASKEEPAFSLRSARVPLDAP